ncbi:shikimate dehydrogenase [Novosphingobium kunmingense]|uniref:Shikimate dehydrogenase n=1 Tax=Novosphingobium kunmingense TaxID=1211806 RepID=A0A2N0H3I0_9SPHN|nr:shikimate dehydrogenase [Novosphingobium kunmingense]PKB13493.1 shikimate dehydrogenase [Novosphingobium kunmingense]
MSDIGSHVVGLIGRGIAASRSPRIHEDAGRGLQIPLAYRLVDFAALGLGDEELPRIVSLLRGIGFSGCNVTFPFKQAALALCDSLSSDAATLGAVNTLVFRDGTVRGENTDWVGFSWMIEREIGDVRGAMVAQVGAGGAGSATAYALAHKGVKELRLFDPDSNRSAELANRISTAFPECRLTVADDAAEAIAGAAGVVNATPIGMASLPGVPFDPALMHGDQWLADIIYFPLQTQLLSAAKANGQRVANGVSMVIGQAAEAFRHFTGLTPDREHMLARMLGVLDAEQHPGART